MFQKGDFRVFVTISGYMKRIHYEFASLHRHVILKTDLRTKYYPGDELATQINLRTFYFFRTLLTFRIECPYYLWERILFFIISPQLLFRLVEVHLLSVVVISTIRLIAVMTFTPTHIYKWTGLKDCVCTRMWKPKKIKSNTNNYSYACYKIHHTVSY